VFSSWEAIDRLLTAAHMAYLVLVMMVEFAKRGKMAEIRELMARLKETLRSRFARAVEEMTLGRFMRLIAVDFPSPYTVGAAL
jgi:Tfp pilus assembly protein PilO